MLVLVACDLPFPSPTSLLPLGIHPNLSSPWNTSAAVFFRPSSPFIAPLQAYTLYPELPLLSRFGFGVLGFIGRFWGEDDEEWIHVNLC